MMFFSSLPLVFDDIASSFGSFRDFYAFGTDAVMIGNAITRNLNTKKTNLVFLRHLISLAQNIGISTVATGVNTTMTIEYYECQLRMIDEDGGILTENELIPVMERIGLLRLFDRYVLEKAISEAMDEPNIVLGLNLSKFAATDNAWPYPIIEKLRERPDIASRLIFEFRDIGTMQNSEECVRLLGMLREFGCRISVYSL